MYGPLMDHGSGAGLTTQGQAQTCQDSQLRFKRNDLADSLVARDGLTCPGLMTVDLSEDAACFREGNSRPNSN